MNILTGVLTRFRKYEVAIIADIEAMFHQVKVAPHDCDSLRFLWWPEGNMSLNNTPHWMKVHIFGANSSPSCTSFCLRQAAVDYGADYEMFIATAAEENFYVNDCLISVPDIERGIQNVEEFSSILSRAGFHLTKWLSNNHQVLSTVPEDERANSVQINTLDNELHDRVSGVQWNVASDEFKFIVALQMQPQTRRGILSSVNSLFDALGFLSPVILEARLIY